MDTHSAAEKPLKVNGRIIPEEAVRYELSRLVRFYSDYMTTEQVKEQLPALRRRAREQAVGAKLLMEEAEQLDMPVPAERIDAKLEKIVESCGGADAFESRLRDQGLSEDMVKRSVEKGLKVDLLLEKLAEGLDDPTEAEMEAHFAEHAVEYTLPERALAQHILIRPGSESEADRAVARSRLEELRRKLADGASFADVAAAHSECPSGRKSGGSLGWFSRGMMVKAFDDAVFSMSVGALSEVVETDFGFHLIYKAGHEPGGPAAYEDVSDKIREFLRHVKRGEAVSAHVKELAEKAVIEGL